MQIVHADLNFEREPLAAPWGFKGGYLTELWQSIVILRGGTGAAGLGLGTQSVLWCDPRVFTATSEAGGNAAMLMLTERALQLARGTDSDSPVDLFDRLLPDVLDYGRKVTGLEDLREVFALNALVPVDNAAWMLWAIENDATDFDALIPPGSRAALAHKQSSVISVPAVGYGLAIESIVKLVQDGFFVLKIKLGSDPEKDGDPAKMLEWDAERMEAIHSAVGGLEAPGSQNGRVLYYLDANGRYDRKERIWQLLERLEDCGALAQTILLEEPFPEEVTVSVGDIPIRVVADESASNVEETRRRIALGYGAVALKPIAKSLSVTFRIAALCHELGVPAFCADLTVNPILVDWNMNIAARLASLPGIEGGMQETNGFQNYRDWGRLLGYHPLANGNWSRPAAGRFMLDREFYDSSGGVLTPSDHYLEMVRA
jgi:hypothetical protein